jgi:hypothetical protein
MNGATAPLPPYVLMAWYLVKCTRLYPKVSGLAAWNEEL